MMFYSGVTLLEVGSLVVCVRVLCLNDSPVYLSFVLCMLCRLKTCLASNGTLGMAAAALPVLEFHKYVKHKSDFNLMLNWGCFIAILLFL